MRHFTSNSLENSAARCIRARRMTLILMIFIEWRLIPLRFMRRYCLLFGLVFVALLSSSFLFASGNGTYDFLRNDTSPRAAAMGGSYVTMMDDPTTIFYNPAGLGSLSRTRVSFGFFKHLLDINEGYASYGTEIPNLGFVGGGVEYINYGEFKRTGLEGQDLGTFGAGELALIAAYAGELRPDVHYGASMKFIYSSIAEVSSTG